MPSSSHQPTPPASVEETARARVTFGPEPMWAVREEFDPTFRGGPGESVTWLLIQQRGHVASRCTHTRTVSRLENMLAVQHMSQWRLKFDPATQRVVIHSILVRREGMRKEHAQPEKIRVLQREEGLDAFVLYGQHTVLVLLEDVRVGDLLDVSYTIETKPRLLEKYFTAFFHFDRPHSLGSLHFGVIFPSDHGIAWKSASETGAPGVEDFSGETRWSWHARELAAREAEPGTPDWFMEHHWIQVSDIPDWGVISAEVASRWTTEGSGQALEEQAALICQETEAPAERVEKAIRFVQDGFRYLSCNIELGGMIPSPPCEVMARRYGDCKDLSFLLTSLLNKLGIEARPVLVHTKLGKVLPDFLPSPSLVNHAVAEFTLDGKTHWVDATLRRQGGGPSGRHMPGLGHGLRISGPGENLVPQPAALWADTYDLEDTILIDSTGDHTILRVTVRASGSYADSFRDRLAEQGFEEFCKGRNTYQKGRYGHSEPDGPLRLEDNRDTNEWRMTEVYRILPTTDDHPTVISAPKGSPRFLINLTHASLTLASILNPAKEKRKTPLALVHPVRISHRFEIRFPFLDPLGTFPHVFQNDWIWFRRTTAGVPGGWTHTTEYETKTDFVPADQILKHRELITKILPEATWAIQVRKGVPRLRREPDFDLLPPPSPRQAEITRHALPRPPTAKPKTAAEPPRKTIFNPPTRKSSSRSAGSASGSRRRRSLGSGESLLDANISPTGMYILLRIGITLIVFLLFFGIKILAWLIS